MVENNKRIEIDSQLRQAEVNLAAGSRFRNVFDLQAHLPGFCHEFQ